MSRLPFLEDINPWTYRHKSTLDTFRQSKSDRFIEETRLPHAAKLLPIHPPPKQQRLKPDGLRIFVPRHFHSHDDYRIPTLSLEKLPLEHIEKTFTFHPQSHFKPLKCKSNQTMPCFVSSPLKWKHRASHFKKKPEIKEQSPIKISMKAMKMRRYYTQEIEMADQAQGQDPMEVFANLLSVNKLPSAANCDQLSESIKECTRIHTYEVSGNVKSFHEIKGMDKESSFRGGHLSQMKKVYNRKKLQRLARP